MARGARRGEGLQGEAWGGLACAGSVAQRKLISGGAIMSLWHRDTRQEAGVAEEIPTLSAGVAGYEAKRQRALQILGERWLLHRANAPDRRPARSVLARERVDLPPGATH